MKSAPAKPPPRRAWAVIAAAVPFHALLAGATDLSPDEAYYLCAAREGGAIPRLVDHPPLIVWMLRLGDHLGFLPVELRVRLWAVGLSAALSIACVLLARRRGAGPEGCVAAAWLSSFCLLPTAGGFITTPDAPALLAAAACLAWAAAEERTLGDTLLAGAAVALGSLAKVVVPAVAATTALFARGARPLLRLAWLFPVLLVAPLLLPSLRFQLRHAFGRAEAPWSPQGAVGALVAAAAAQALLWSPWAFARGAVRIGRMPRSDRALVIVMTALVAVSAVVRATPPEPNWWAPAALVVIASAAVSTDELAPRRRLAMLALAIAPTFVAAAHAIHPFLPIPASSDPTARLHGWSRGDGPTDATGVGPYGLAAEACVYRHRCDEINSYFAKLSLEIEPEVRDTGGR